MSKFLNIRTVLLINALFLSGIAAFYAVTGLIAIFATAVIPIAIMGIALESAKLVIASWLYRRWNDITKVMRYYFSVSLVILMFLTSMGIFGFLSKAHLDQAVPSGEVSSQVYILDDKIKYQRSIIERNQKAIKQLDDLVEQTIGRSTDEKSIDKATALRRQQEAQRNRLVGEIERAQNQINTLTNQRAPIASQLRKIEAEVGPIKYIAALIYGDKIDESILEKAVRFVIIIIVFVFDPLAVMMLVAWNREIVFASGTLPPSSPISKPEPTPNTPIVPTQIFEDIKSAFRKKLQVLGTKYTEKKKAQRNTLVEPVINTTTEIKPTAFYQVDKTDIYETVERPTDSRPVKFEDK